jgi:hypothetical protein
VDPLGRKNLSNNLRCQPRPVELILFNFDAAVGKLSFVYGKFRESFIIACMDHTPVAATVVRNAQLVDVYGIMQVK